MKNRWTLHIEDFGSIRSADIEVAPMMLFVGENNTGKSYLASLLWGLLDQDTIVPVEILTSDAYKRCEELMIGYLKAEEFEINGQMELRQDIIDAILIWYNEILNNEKDNLVQKIFSNEGMSIDRLSIQNISYSKPIILNKDMMNIPYHFQGISDHASRITRASAIFNVKKKVKLKPALITLFIQNIVAKIFTSSILERNYPFYLPASRTGFMLSYKSLAAGLMNLWGLDKQEVQTTFTLPTIRFLQKLIKAEMSTGSPFANIAESLEKQILKGKIIQNSQTQSFYYAPESNPTNLMPLHTTSSLVTELAPLIIFLKDRMSKFNLLIFEEPESHLHLSAQRILAKHLVKLVNMGLPVWITTHSDTMFQQFNNLIGSTEKRTQKLKNLSYQDDEIIKPEDIKAYQFNIAEDGKTDVVPLEQTENGLVAPTFNKAIIELSEEAIHLEAESEDAD